MLDSWQPDTIRLTAFWSTPQVVDSGLWKRLVGHEPESTLRKGGTVQEAGAWQNADQSNLLIIASALGVTTVQWKHNPQQPGNAGVAVLSSGVLEFLRSALEPLAERGSIIRLAFGATLFRFVADRRAGYIELSKLLPSVRLDADKSSDFLYRINRPVRSQVAPALELNRLATWSVTEFFELVMAVGDPTRQLQMPRSHACQVDLDINTSARNADPLQANLLPGLWDELVAIGETMSKEGDVP